MTIRQAIVVCCLSALVLGWAEAGKADEQAGRYAMMPTEGGFIRLDTATGVAEFCSGSGGTWSCNAMPDGQQKLRDELARLEAENKSLKDEIRHMEEMLGLTDKEEGAPSSKPGEPMSPESGPPAPKSKVPTEEDVDRMFDYIEGMVRKFKERIERLDKEAPASPKVPPSAPDGRGTPL